MSRRWILGFGSIALLAGCGRVADLQPRAGHPMPVKPMMARAAPTVQQLLTPPTYAHPDRVDELVKRSQPRAADPFDLPPPTGGAAPSLPPGNETPPPPDSEQQPAPGMPVPETPPGD